MWQGFDFNSAFYFFIGMHKNPLMLCVASGGSPWKPPWVQGLWNLVAGLVWVAIKTCHVVSCFPMETGVVFPSFLRSRLCDFCPNRALEEPSVLDLLSMLRGCQSSGMCPLVTG